MAYETASGVKYPPSGLIWCVGVTNVARCLCFRCAVVLGQSLPTSMRDTVYRSIAGLIRRGVHLRWRWQFGGRPRVPHRRCTLRESRKLDWLGCMRCAIVSMPIRTHVRRLMVGRHTMICVCCTDLKRSACCSRASCTDLWHGTASGYQLRFNHEFDVCFDHERWRKECVANLNRQYVCASRFECQRLSRCQLTCESCVVVQQCGHGTTDRWHS